MDRRELFGALGVLGVTLPVAASDHGKAEPAAAANPLTGPHAHFCGIHTAKNNPKFQIVTQHYCAGHKSDGHDDMFQCVLFDGTGAGAKLLGVEYIISDAAYRTLPDAEKKYWHAHTYEVLGGGLIAPGMAPADEAKFMKMVLTTWGKAWHTWPDPKTAVPVGEPLLIWSLTADGQADENIVAARDKAFNVSTAKIREARGKELGLDVPKVSAPASMDAIGRQWTNTGDDVPTKK